MSAGSCNCQQCGCNGGPYYEVKTQEDDSFGSREHTVLRGDVELLYFLAHNPHRAITVRRSDEHPWDVHYVEESAIQVALKEGWPKL
jgi:hypothetical protein